MDFETQIEALTGLTLGINVTTDQIDRFLQDAVIDVTDKCINLRPDKISDFARASTEQSNNDSFDLGGSPLISVVRESGTSDDWRACRQIGPDLQSRVTDINSIHYASAYNPAFSVMENGKINVYPAPSSSNGTFKVYYVNSDPVNSINQDLASDHRNIGYFPKDKVYLVVIYAAVKCLDHLVHQSHSLLPSSLSDVALNLCGKSVDNFVSPGAYVAPVEPSSVDIDFSEVGSVETFTPPTYVLEDLPTIPDMSLPSIPTAPSLIGTIASVSETAPEYVKPVPSITSDITLGTLTISVTPPSPPVVSSNAVDFSFNAPTYVSPTVSPDYSDANTWINTEEDSEMSAARVQVIQARLSQYQTDIQNSLNTFNKENAAYQIEFQKASTNAQNATQSDSNNLSKYQAELTSYTNQVNKEVQEHQTRESLRIQLFQTQRQHELSQYSSDIQNELNKFNKENTEYQAQLQIDIQNATLADGKQNRDLQKYTQELSSYSAQVNTEVQRWVNEEYNKVFNEWQTKIDNKMKEYQVNLQKEQARVDSSLKDYQAKFNKAIQTYQAESGNDLGLYSAKVQSATTRFQSDLSRNNGEFQNSLAEFTAEFQRVSAQNQDKLTKYSAEVQNYVNEVNKVQIDVDLYIKRSMKLEKQYNESFMVMAPKQQQKATTRR